MEFTVTTLQDAGVGSLRWAITAANRHAGFDRIDIDRSLSGGAILLERALPTIRDRVAIRGLLQDSGRANLVVDYQGHQGLSIRGARAARSSLQGLALVQAGGDGLTLDAPRISVQNCLIGVGLDGITAMGNQGHGIRITARSHHNRIGTLDPLTGLPLDRQVSNVISANAGAGIVVQGSDHNRIANNRIGTTADGTADLGNADQGIVLTDRARRNRIGGTAHRGNDPTKGAFQRPGQGNLISGNGAEGVLIHRGSSRNRLMGNFIGTDAAGSSAIGNDGDGVAIIAADRNGLIGTTRNQSPFIYYNVVSGNGGNGLRVRDSDAITIHANFFGLGADNQTVVANAGDGALIEGRSMDIQYGGVIPLGNVNAGNRGHGLHVTDRVSRFVTFNTFAGLTAFGGIAPNRKSGICISSDGGRNQVRTNVLSGNRRHGLHLTGAARGIWVDPNIIGLNTYGTEATYSDSSGALISWGNGGDGIRVDGQAADIRIAGQRPSVIPQNTVSNNDGHGIRLAGRARRITIDQTFVGFSSGGRAMFGNGRDGISIGARTRAIRIGQRGHRRHGNQIVANAGDGIDLRRPRGAQLFNNTLQDNGGSGIVFRGGRDNALIANTAITNQGYGFAVSSAAGTVASRNRGRGNGLGLFG